MTNLPMEIERIFLLVAMGILAICMLFCLLRTLIGPRVSDRIVGVNMLSTFVIAFIAVLSVYLGESYIADISLLYAMLSFLAVVIITRIYINIYRSGRKTDGKGGAQ